RGRGWPPWVVLPWYTQFAGQDRPIAGQVGGRMGEVNRPFLVQGDPSQPGFHIAGLRLPEGLSLERVETRNALKTSLDGASDRARQRVEDDRGFGAHYSTAIAMLGDPRKAKAFELDREPEATRERYGPTKFARSLLMARRLIEAGISLVTVNYDDETRNEKVSPFWDTHHQN